ncbi:MAG TPA: helix-turn-helix transcriptional regulator, partial [Vicinamibacterales bacterium]|nr:helix-turn-helix transcriptional regulator [Vicinamibacterales bacterium]
MPIEHARNPLRRARLAARLELSDLAERTRISPGMLRYMDEGAFERLPPGIYARAWVRSVARALSLDPAEVLRELEPVLPQAAPPEPAPPARAKRLQRLIDQPSAGSVMNLIGSETCRRSAVAAVDGALLTAVTM